VQTVDDGVEISKALRSTTTTTTTTIIVRRTAALIGSGPNRRSAITHARDLRPPRPREWDAHILATPNVGVAAISTRKERHGCGPCAATARRHSGLWLR
jgi:hypothetical protein